MALQALVCGGPAVPEAPVYRQTAVTPGPDSGAPVSHYGRAKISEPGVSGVGPGDDQ
jgi:hypothetical protein